MAKKKAEEKPAGDAASFEKELARLEEIVGKLEAGVPGLDGSIKLYEEGVRSLKACQKRLAEAEARIRMLSEGAGGPQETGFDPAAAGEEKEEDESPPPSRRRARKPKGRGLF